MPPEDKTCASCGRRIEWRRKWERDWDSVRYCSTACRRHGVTATDQALEQALLTLLGQGSAGRTVSVERAAEVVAGGTAAAPDDTAALIEPARRAARRLVAAGRVEIVQGGRVVDPSTAKGPFGVRRAR